MINASVLKTNSDLLAFLTGVIQPHATALQGIMDKLPEALKPDFKRLKDDIDEQLRKLAPTDQVPAALDASYALQSLSSTLERVNEYATGLIKKVRDMTETLATQTSALQGFNDRVTSGELVTKATATELCGTARKEALDSMKPTILAMRKQQVELAGLPMPTDELLGSDEPVFAARFGEAKANLVAFGKRGLKVGGKGTAIITDMAWLPASECAGRLNAYEDILGKERTGDPLIGGGGAGAGGAGTSAAATPDEKALLLSMA